MSKINHIKRGTGFDTSLFNHRLMKLMDEAGYDSAPKLAKALYDKGYVSVKQTELKPYEGEDGTEKYKNAIGSIQKKIERHMDAPTANKLQGEFAIAYSKFFNCSTDYILCQTNIRSCEQDVRNICDKTGLSEEAVLNLINAYEQTDHSEQPEWCSMMFESPFFESARTDWYSLINEMQKYAKRNGEIMAKEKYVGQDEANTLVVEFEKSKIKTLKKTTSLRNSAIYGILAKMSRDYSVEMERRATEKIKISMIEEKAYNGEMELLESMNKGIDENSTQKPFKFHDHDEFDI